MDSKKSFEVEVVIEGYEPTVVEIMADEDTFEQYKEELTYDREARDGFIRHLLDFTHMRLGTSRPFFIPEYTLKVL